MIVAVRRVYTSGFSKGTHNSEAYWREQCPCSCIWPLTSAKARAIDTCAAGGKGLTFRGVILWSPQQQRSRGWPPLWQGDPPW